MDPHDSLALRVERERRAHTEDDILGRSIEIKNRFPHIWAYPSRQRLHALAEGYLREISGRRVLDLGCGKGERAVSLLGHGALVDGIDISPVYVEEATRAATAAGFTEERFHFQAGDAHALPYEDGAFSLVVGDGILHHLDLRAALNEVHRVLEPGGRALFFEPLLDNPFLKVFRRLTPRARTEDERPLSAEDLGEIEASGRWHIESQYCGLIAAPLAMVTSVLLRPRQDNFILRAADRLETRLNRVPALRPRNQYVLLNLVRV